MPEREYLRSTICSVIIPTYNRADWLPACVNSARRSGVRGLEIIVVDDGSTDDTREVVAGLGPGVRYFYQANAGVSAARNNGVKYSHVRYVAFLDSDDQWLPDIPGKLVESLEQHPDVAVGFADVWVGNKHGGYRGRIDKSGQDALARLACREARGGFRVLERRQFFRRLASPVYPVHINSVIMRREVFDEVGGFDESLRLGEDWDLFLRLAASYTFGYLPFPMAIHERHVGCQSHGVDHAEIDLEVLERFIGKDLRLPGEELACLKARLAQVLYERAYTAFDRGELSEARARCISWMRSCGPRPRAVLYWCSSWLRPSHVQGLRALKRRVGAVRASRVRR